MKLSLFTLRKLIHESSSRAGGQPLRKGDLVEIYESYEERRRTQGVRKKSEFVDMTRGVIAAVEFGDDGYIRVGLTPDPDAENNLGRDDLDEIFTWAFPSMLRKVR
jgi:hypothetical protein